MNKKTIKDIDIRGKKLLIRCDFNVPLDKNLKITDDARIQKAIPTIQYAIQQKAKVILCSHLGRPEGERKMEDSLKPVAARISEIIQKNVPLLSDCIGPEVTAAVQQMKDGDVVLLENLRFHKAETKNDPAMSRQLASLADIFVNDAFGAAHRAHASTEGVAHLLPAVAGLLLAKEVEYFGKAISNPDKPFLAILGGSKVSDKIQVIENLLDKVDGILIGGGMAYTFLHVKGIAIGKSKCEDAAGQQIAKTVLQKAAEKKIKIFLPVDHVIAQEFKEDAFFKITIGEAIPEGWMGLDVGPKTVALFNEALASAKMIIWNGPLGVFEFDAFDKGSRQVAQYIASLKQTISIIGGGDTAAAIKKFSLEDKMSHISTGGGASLEFLEGKELPGVAALNNKESQPIR